jgi:tRNA(Ile)-lysidine synthase
VTNPPDHAIRRQPLVARLARELERRLGDRLPAGGRSPAVIGVSGGADSVALLLCAAALSRRRRAPWPPPVCVHVHHHLRGPAADADAAFTAALAARLGLEHHERHVHPAGDPGNRAANARRRRLEALADVARVTRRRVVLTAHHAEDQLETVLLRLVRGADRQHLAMPAIRPIAAGADTWLVRPFIGVPRADLRELCRTAGIDWREDRSNADASRPRPRLRAEVLPVLEAIGPGAAARIAAALDQEQDASGPGPAATAADPGGTGRAPRTASRRRAVLAGLPAGDRTLLVRSMALGLAPAAADRLRREQLTELARAVADDTVAPRRWDWPGGLLVELDVRELRISAPADPDPDRR